LPDAWIEQFRVIERYMNPAFLLVFQELFYKSRNFNFLDKSHWIIQIIFVDKTAFIILPESTFSKAAVKSFRLIKG